MRVILSASRVSPKNRHRPWADPHFSVVVFQEGRDIVLLARRHGDRWYVAGLNALKEPLTLTLDVPMLSGQTVRCYVDDKNGTPTLTSLKIKADGRAKVTLQPNGGLILCR